MTGNRGLPCRPIAARPCSFPFPVVGSQSASKATLPPGIYNPTHQEHVMFIFSKLTIGELGSAALKPMCMTW